MKKQKETKAKESTELYYEIKPVKGDVYITINAGRGSEVKVMSGQPTPPVIPPKG